MEINSKYSNPIFILSKILLFFGVGGLGQWAMYKSFRVSF